MGRQIQSSVNAKKNTAPRTLSPNYFKFYIQTFYDDVTYITKFH